MNTLTVTRFAFGMTVVIHCSVLGLAFLAEAPDEVVADSAYVARLLDAQLEAEPKLEIAVEEESREPAFVEVAPEVAKAKVKTAPEKTVAKRTPKKAVQPRPEEKTPSEPPKPTQVAQKKVVTPPVAVKKTRINKRRASRRVKNQVHATPAPIMAKGSATKAPATRLNTGSASLIAPAWRRAKHGGHCAGQKRSSPLERAYRGQLAVLQAPLRISQESPSCSDRR